MIERTARPTQAEIDRAVEVLAAEAVGAARESLSWEDRVTEGDVQSCALEAVHEELLDLVCGKVAELTGGRP